MLCYGRDAVCTMSWLIWDDMICNDMIWYDEAWNGMWWDPMRCNVIWWDEMRWDGMLRYDMIYYIRYELPLHIQCCCLICCPMLWHGMMVWYGVGWHEMRWDVIVWRRCDDMLWYDMTRCSMVVMMQVLCCHIVIHELIMQMYMRWCVGWCTQVSLAVLVLMMIVQLFWIVYWWCDDLSVNMVLNV